MSLRNRPTPFCHPIFPCLNVAEELCEESVSKEDGGDRNVSGISSVCELPEAIVIHEIFPKLSIKSIIRCRNVSKSWYRFILDRYFADVYSKKSLFASIAVSQHLTYPEHPYPHLPYYDDALSFIYVEIEKNGNVTTKPLIKLKAAKRYVAGSWKTIIGSCDGLLCVVVETPREKLSSLTYICNLSYPDPTIWITNPLIRENMVLPEVRGVCNDYFAVYGFGSTLDGNHYKVVRVGMPNLTCVGEAHILTIGVDRKWRQLDYSSMPTCFYPRHGVNLNGSLHWFGARGHADTASGVIDTFDIGKETGYCFALPCAHNPHIILAVRDGNLCISDHSNDLQIDIWTMKQYGNVESWSRDVIRKSSFPFQYHFFPSTIMRNGDLLFIHRHKSMIFDLKAKKCIDLGRAFELIDGNTSLLHSHSYSPSFFSPRDIITKLENCW